MKMTTKLVILLVLGLLSLGFLISCHGSRDIQTFSVPDSFDENKQYEITFWAKNDNNKTQQEIYYNAIAEFEKIYPNIKVNLKPFVNYNDIYREVLTNIQTSTTPNVCITYPDHIATYITGDNIVVPLDELIADEKYGLGGSEIRFDSPTKDEVIDKFLAEGVIDGTQYAIPFMRSTEACYINVDLVEKLGYTVPEQLTWDFIFEVSRAALEPIGVNENGDPIYINGQTIMVPFLYKSTDNMMIQMLKQKGYEYSNDEGEILMFNDDTKSLLYMLSDRVKEGSFTTFSISAKYPGDLINAGRCIFGIDSTAGATWIGPGSPNYEIDEDSMVNFQLAVKPIPQFYPDKPVMISQGPSVCIFNKNDSGEVLASWLFAQYLLTNEVQIAYAQTEGYVPVTSKAQQSEEYLDYLSRAGQLDENGSTDLYYAPKITASRILLDNIDNTFITPVFNGSASLRNAAGYLIEETGKSVKRGFEINDAQLEKIFTKARANYSIIETSSSSDGKVELGPMPTASVVMLVSIGGVWVMLGVCALVSHITERKKKEQ